MNVCVVGNGPSAEGKGTEIDACDFVVRIKAWWCFGAEDAGSKCDAWAHFGCAEVQMAYRRAKPLLPEEEWITHTRTQTLETGDYAARFRFMDKTARDPSITVPEWLWFKAKDHLDRHPSTGFVAVCIAMHRFRPECLRLFGFDSMTPDRPGFEDARLHNRAAAGIDHDFVAEKRALAQIAKGLWLGEPCDTELIWPDMPEGAC